jgi:DNA-binding LytR/AlgR family response regulator
MDPDTPLRCLIADDDPSSQALISSYVDRHANLETMAVCADGIEAANAIREKDVDLLLLDVEMPDMSGLELVESLNDPPAVVIVSGHEEYAIDAFDVAVTDYLVKPVRYARFLRAIDRVLAWAGHPDPEGEGASAATSGDGTSASGVPDVNAGEPSKPKLVGSDHVFVKDGRRFIRVALPDIQWIEAQGDYMLIRTGDDRYMVNTTMKTLEDKLPADQFLRIHRSYLVRIDQVKDIEDTTLVVDGTMLPIGPSYREDLIDHIRTL